MAWKSSEAGTSMVQDQHVKHCWEANQDEHGELIVGASKQDFDKSKFAGMIGAESRLE